MIYKVVILSLTLLIGVALIKRLWVYDEIHRPHFQSKQCFMFDTYHHHHADGIVTMVDDLYYTVMWSQEAERRYAGPKIGYHVPIKWLDRWASRVECPKEWLNHKGGKKR